MEIYKQIGVRIKEARKASGITQEQLGTYLGLARASITRIEAGRHHISIEKLNQVAKLNDQDLSDFLCGVGTNAPKNG